MSPACENVGEPSVVSMLMGNNLCLWAVICSVGYRNHLMEQQPSRHNQKPLHGILQELFASFETSGSAIFFTANDVLGEQFQHQAG